MENGYPDIQFDSTVMRQHDNGRWSWLARGGFSIEFDNGDIRATGPGGDGLRVKVVGKDGIIGYGVVVERIDDTLTLALPDSLWVDTVGMFPNWFGRPYNRTLVYLDGDDEWVFTYVDIAILESKSSSSHEFGGEGKSPTGGECKGSGLH